MRLIKYDKIEPIMFAVDHEIEYKKPTLICGFPKRPFLMLTGKYPIDKYLRSSEVPVDMDIIRMPVTNNGESGVLCLSEDTVKIYLHLPPKMVDPETLERTLLANTIKTLGAQKRGIILQGNDLLIELDGNRRKFLGAYKSRLVNDWEYYSVNISFKVDYDLMNKIYRLDTPKMDKKGPIKDMKEIVIGVDEFIPGIDKQKFLDEFIFNLAQRMNWKLEEEGYTPEEEQRIKEILPVLTSEEWIQEAKQYNSKVKQWLI